jgi:predicted RNA-binding protein with RPS1 domain
MSDTIKSGKEIVDDFFKNIHQIPSVDKDIADALLKLYEEGKLTEVNIKNGLQTIRNNAANKN